MDTIQNWLAIATAWWHEQFWPLLNTNFISGLIPAIVGIVLARRVAEVADSNKATESLRSAQAQVSALDKEEGEAVEVNIVAPAAVVGIAPEVEQGAPDSVAQLDDKIDAIKGDIEDKIRHLDGRRRRKYDNIARYDYRPIIIMLAQDGAVRDATAYRLVDLMTVWRTHRRKKHQLPEGKAAEILAFEW